MIIIHPYDDGLAVTIAQQIESGSSGMIIVGGNDTSGGIDYGTMSDDTSWTLDDLCRSVSLERYEVDHFDIDWFKMVNAEEATKRMVAMARDYHPPIYKNHHRAAFKVNKAMFSVSGKLPKRIRRIRK